MLGRTRWPSVSLSDPIKKRLTIHVICLVLRSLKLPDAHLKKTLNP
ncbi:hypothetical protein ABIE16_002518 [Pseudomonas sp. 2725]|jgi:hypothetical protein